jgi:hypothetical protein
MKNAFRQRRGDTVSVTVKKRTVQQNRQTAMIWCGSGHKHNAVAKQACDTDPEENVTSGNEFIGHPHA